MNTETTFSLDDKLSFLQDLLLYNNQIFFWKFSMERELIHCNCPAKNTLMNYIFLDMPSSVFQSLEFEKINIYSSSLGLFWALIPFHEQQQDCLYALGPVFYQEINERTFKKRMDTNHMSISSQLKVLHLLNEIPIVSNGNFQGFAGMLFFTLYQRKALANEMILLAPHTVTEKNYEVTTHGTYAWEQQLVRCIEEGNLNYKKELEIIGGQSSSNLIAGITSPLDPIRQAKNEAIVATTIVTRAAIRGGMNSEIAYSLSDYYIQHVESCTGELEAHQLLYQMCDSFVEKVFEIRQGEILSNIVGQCYAIIQQNIWTNIDLKSVAKALGFTPYYVSSMFKKETGKTINHYIMEQKIERAKFLLASTTLSILEISNELFFSSPSYFSHNFKKIVGKTPQEFRKRPNGL